MLLLLLLSTPAAGAEPADCGQRIGDAGVTGLVAFADALTGRLGVVVEVSEKTCEAINKAVRSLPPEGGTVVLAEGEYLCSNPLVIDRDNVTVKGAGRGRTILRARDATPIPVIVIGSIKNTEVNQDGVPYPDHVTRNVTLTGLTADGNYQSHPNPGAVECWDPKTATAKGCDGDAESIRNNGLTVRRAENIKVDDFDARANYSGGIVTEKYCKNLLMQNFSASGNWFDGFAGYETTASVFRNFQLNSNKYSGISADIRFKGNVFEKGELIGNGDNGVFSNAVSDNLYKNLVVRNNANNGYYFDGHRDREKNIIPGYCNGNRIEGGEIEGGRSGIFINSSCQDFRVDHVKIHHPSGRCTRFTNAAQVEVRGGSVCDDGKAVRPIDGDYSGLDNRP